MNALLANTDMGLTTYWGNLSEETIRADAIAHHNRVAWGRRSTAILNSYSEDDQIDRATVNYLRHELTNYDEILEGCHPHSQKHHRIWVQFFREMAHDYPSLIPALEKQLRERLRFLNAA
jgi:hypothetical protein